ncbi:hypothetical protein ODJ79_09005 [Actinoplanes sp. KI2]|uniref:hypothetical protein n=1 Tax=Actinoplanes sp. KI2 TaxID=2983315 RepID=UPI0021D59982|nr:hypothetical protein [Actinoplanes sp. KI2]MCU7723850.1 hypothetical protein [Actinoplanes sp. KI2]
MSLKGWLPVSLLGAMVGSAVLITTGTANPGTASEPLPVGACPADAPDDGAVIDWVPFVVVDGVTYRTVYAPESALTDGQVGAVAATVKCRIAGAVNDPDFHPRTGDAAFLAPGTEVHFVLGSPASARLAVQEDGIWRRYEAVATTP